MMTTNDMLQSSEEERLKMPNCCCLPNDNHMSPNNDPIAVTAYTFLSLALTKRIEQLEEELTKHGIDIPEWKEFLK